jgi:hypothetical protein
VSFWDFQALITVFFKDNVCPKIYHRVWPVLKPLKTVFVLASLGNKLNNNSNSNSNNNNIAIIFVQSAAEKVREGMLLEFLLLNFFFDYKLSFSHISLMKEKRRRWWFNNNFDLKNIHFLN